MSKEEAIKILKEHIKADRNARNNKVESDLDKFCESECVAIETLLKELRLAEINVKEMAILIPAAEHRGYVKGRQAEKEKAAKDIATYYIDKDKIKSAKSNLLKKCKKLTQEEREKNTMYYQGKLIAYEELLGGI